METTTRKKRYAPTDDDYDICCIRLEPAENGVTVICEYRLKDDAKGKMKKGDSYVPYDIERVTESNVFEKKADAKAFISAELDEVWSD